ncbi:hypothetical protein [Cryobacterium sp. PH31-O1]|uniref:TY-Chap2 family putative peptide chaperone n=1 Tax=Cryobacterium sp. PH31-O1 TaxID=3046306 RepID=UPI0024B9605A|nr:hypothetical protein [Cryobacterium sp. PH31-O1]MDJ0339063.1 hypothetical protein [Cryobacterium sp. PH31-O1]
MSDDSGSGGFDRYRPPADRFLTAQMWWIASELVRRHPHLLISRITDSSGAPLLLVHDEQAGMRIQLELVGGIRFVASQAIGQVSWIQILSTTTSQEIVTTLERQTGLQPLGVVPDTTPRALVYRVIENFLNSVINDGHEWDVVTAPMPVTDTTVNDLPASEYLHAFPSTAPAISHYKESLTVRPPSGGTQLFHQPFWALLRDLEPIAIFDIAGIIHTGTTPHQMMPLFEAAEHRLSSTTRQVLGSYQP